MQVKQQQPNTKRTSNSRLLGFEKLILYKPYDQTRLPHGCITQQDKFKMEYFIGHIDLMVLKIETGSVLDK